MTTPEDIRRAANISVSSFEARIQAGDFANPSGTEAREALIAEFERAILAAEKREREACAQIAREHDMASGESIAHMIMTRNEWQPAAVRKVLESSDA